MIGYRQKGGKRIGMIIIGNDSLGGWQPFFDLGISHPLFLDKDRKDRRDEKAGEGRP